MFILYLGRKLHTQSYQPLFVYLCGKQLGRLLDIVVTLFLFGAMVVMLAGAGAIFEEHLGISRLWGVLATVLLALITVFYGLKGVMAANTLLIPVMILLTAGISIYSLNYHGVSLADLGTSAPQVAAAPHWLLAALLYISYNLILAVPVLAPMGKETRDFASLFTGGMLGGTALGILSLLLALVIMAHLPGICDYQVPMLFIVRPYAAALRICYTFVLWGEIFTTLIADLYGLALRLSQYPGFTYRKTVIISLLAALLLSKVGFSTLVGIVYPLLGYAGLIFIGALILKLPQQFR
ncbi:MAG TPA: hypothetical protein VHS59_07260 [Bacillota bacterium]|nr:hypothetical protein [Bacillota bacterium]